MRRIANDALCSRREFRWHDSDPIAQAATRPRCPTCARHEIYQAPDSQVLEWAARAKRILLSHDVRTLINHAYARVEQGLSMPGVIIVPSTLEIGIAVGELEMTIGAGKPEDFENLVTFIPLR